MGKGAFRVSRNNYQRTMMNILHVRSSGGMFGAEGVILNLARELNAKGHKNHIVCIRNVKNPHTELVDAAHKMSLNAESVNCEGRIDFETVKGIRTIIEDKQVDILHCHDYKANMHGLLASRKAGVKRITTNHLWTSETGLLRLYEFIDGIAGNYFDTIVGVSDRITDQVKRYLLRKDKAITIYNGIDLDFYSPEDGGTRNLRAQLGVNDDQILLGAVGRLSVQKGYPYLLQALQLLKAVCPGLRLVFVGAGDQHQSLKALVEELGLGEMVRFAGIQMDMQDVYRSIDVLTMSSIAEGLPLVMLEALAMKVPVVATRVGAIGNVLTHQKTGLICEPEDPHALAQQMKCVILDKNLRAVLRRNGRDLMERKLSSKAMALAYEGVYGGVIGS